MDIRQLSYFVKVAQRGSLTAAAAELGIAQPTLTKSVRQLEAELGILLFTRLPRGVCMTPAGLRLMQHARSIDVQIEDAKRDLEQLRTGVDGEIVIGAGPAWLRRRLPDAVARTAIHYPSLRFRVIGGFEADLIEQLRSGQIDFVMAELPRADARNGLEVTPLVVDQLVAMARSGHPLADKTSKLSQLLRFSWVMHPAPTSARLRLDSLFLAQGLPTPTVAVETTSMAFLLRVVRRTDFITLAVKTTLDAPDGRGLLVLRVPELVAERQAGVIARRGAILPPAASFLIETLTRACARDPAN